MPEGNPSDTTGANPGGQNPGTEGAKAWYEGNTAIDQGLVTKWKDKGWKLDNPTDLAIAATKSYMQAESLIGHSPELTVKLPKDANAPEWNGVWQKLGRPADAKGYDFSGIKFADGTDLDAGFTDFMRETAFKRNLPASAARSLAEDFTKFLEGSETRELAENTAAVSAEKQTLAKNWGPNHAQNMLVAQNAVRALGLDPATVNALEGVVGYAKVMEMFRNIGSKIGEDKFIATEGNGAGGKGVMTLDAAKVRKAELYKDTEWVKKFNAGGVDQRREMTALDTIISGVNLAR